MPLERLVSYYSFCHGSLALFCIMNVSQLKQLQVLLYGQPSAIWLHIFLKHGWIQKGNYTIFLFARVLHKKKGGFIFFSEQII